MMQFSLSSYMEVLLPAEFREENSDAEKSHTHGWSLEFLEQRNPKKVTGGASVSLRWMDALQKVQLKIK